MAVTGFVNVATGECIYTVIYPIVPIVLAISDALLSLAMLGIFVVPLYVHEKLMSSVGHHEELKEQLNAVIRRNITCSFIALVGGNLSLISLATLMWIAVADGTPETYNLRAWGLFGITFDSSIGILAVHGMTSGWHPSFIRSCLRRSRHLLGSSSQKSAAVMSDGHNNKLEPPRSPGKSKPKSVIINNDASDLVASPSDA